MADIEELGHDSVADVGFGPNEGAVAELVERARHLSRPEVHALAQAVAWQWQALVLPIRGSYATARSEALAAARAAGRGPNAMAAQDEARRAAFASPGGRASAPHWSWAEDGLAGILIGVIGAIVSASFGLVIVAVVFGLLAVTGSAVLLFHESGFVMRRRLAAAVEAAALATALTDLLPPDTAHVLLGPWSGVIRD